MVHRCEKRETGGRIKPDNTSLGQRQQRQVLSSHPAAAQRREEQKGTAEPAQIPTRISPSNVRKPPAASQLSSSTRQVLRTHQLIAWFSKPGCARAAWLLLTAHDGVDGKPPDSFAPAKDVFFFIIFFNFFLF